MKPAAKLHTYRRQQETVCKLLKCSPHGQDVIAADELFCRGIFAVTRGYPRCPCRQGIQMADATILQVTVLRVRTGHR